MILRPLILFIGVTALVALGAPRARARPTDAARQPAADRPVPRIPGPQERGPDWDALGADLWARIAREREGEVAVTLLDVGSRRRLDLNADVEMHAASTMKVAVLLELFRQAEAGRFAAGDSIAVRNEFVSIADGSRYSLTREDDGEGALYDLLGGRTTIRDLARRMIVRSSNLATNILIELVTADSVRATLERLGAGEMRVLRGVEDAAAYRQGLNNTTSSRAFARVLEAIARCEVTSAASCDEMVQILSGQEFNEQIPAGLPPGVRVAHKTGQITGVHHDGGIVYPPDRAPYVLVMLTHGISDTLASARVGADISRSAWRALVFGDAGRSPFPGDSLATRLLALHGRVRVPEIEARRFTHSELWSVLGPMIEEAPALSREPVGRSVEGRPFYLVRFGTGPTRVLLWSQMHGDESTATMALADLFRLLSREPQDPLVQRLSQRITLLAVPMLNPDGAERFQRRNAQGIDVNRDARALVTPEGQALKVIRDRFQPAFGLNLHDQNVRTLVGNTGRTAAFALLAPAFDSAGSDNEVRGRAKQVAAYVRRVLDPFAGAYVSRYDEAFNPRAFGDLMQGLGTSTVLIESGGWENDPEKQYLRRLNFVAIVSALDAISAGHYEEADVAWYETLPLNAQRANDLLVRGGTLVVPGQPPYRADLAIDFADPLAVQGGRIADIGDLEGYTARDTLDASELFLHLERRALVRGPGARRAPNPGVPATLTARRGAAATSAAVWSMRRGIVERAKGPGDGAPVREAGARSGAAQEPGPAEPPATDTGAGAATRRRATPPSSRPQ